MELRVALCTPPRVHGGHSSDKPKVASFADSGPFFIQQRIIPPIDWILSRRSHPKALIGNVYDLQFRGGQHVGRLSSGNEASFLAC